jgi:hypothetical protein
VTMMLWVLLAAFTTYAIKVSGYLLPQSVLDRPPVTELAGTLTVGLLASLTALNTVATGQAVTLDSRFLSLLAGGIALKLKAPYIVVVIAGAVAAATGRRLGLA